MDVFFVTMAVIIFSFEKYHVIFCESISHRSIDNKHQYNPEYSPTWIKSHPVIIPAKMDLTEYSPMGLYSGFYGNKDERRKILLDIYQCPEDLKI